MIVAPPLPSPTRHEVWRKVAAHLRPIPVPPVASPADSVRRNRCARDLLAYCQTYHSDVFRDPNSFHIAVLSEIQSLVLSPAAMCLKKSLAGVRGIGKSTCACLAILWAAVYGHIRYGLIISAVGSEAEKRHSAIRQQVLCNNLLFGDFPELCGPIREFNGDPRRASPGYPWSTHVMRLPNGVFIEARGADGAIAGALQDFHRPDFILIDDLEDLEISKSESQIADRSRKLHDEILPLPERGAHSVVLFICTTWSSDCNSAVLTDPALAPEWRPARYPALLAEPSRTDLWDVFLGFLRPADARNTPEKIPDAIVPGPLSDTDVCAAAGLALETWAALTPEARRAFSFYAANRTAMDSGAKVLDEHRMPLAQIYYDRACLGDVAWFCQYQQAPPRDTGERKDFLAIALLQGRRRAELARDRAPEWAEALLVSVDVGAHRLHWELDAWSFSKEVSAVLDAGYATTGLDEDGRWSLAGGDETVRKSLLERAVRDCLERLRGQFAAGLPLPSGEILLPRCAVDCAGQAGGGPDSLEDLAWTRTILEFCASTGGRWLAFRGARWTDAHRKRAGERNIVWSERGFVETHANYYKTRLYAALQRPPADAAGNVAMGARVFSAGLPTAYLHQQQSESCDDRGRWSVAGRVPNHWWDTAYMQFALADVVRVNNSKPRRVKVGIVGRAFL